MVQKLPIVVLITGCSDGGIGSALAKVFAESKGTNVIVYATARKIENMKALSSHSNINLLSLDVNLEPSIENVIKTIKSEQGGLDIIINNAGVGCVGAVIDVPPHGVAKVFETNVFSVIKMSRAAVPLLLARKEARSGEGNSAFVPKIINIGSVVGNVSTPWGGLYCASKAAVHSLTDAMRLELRPFGISVCVVRPGSIKSNIGNNNAAYNLFYDAATSLFKPFEKNIIARATASQSSRATPSEEFAAKVVRLTLTPGYLPAYYTYGFMSTLFFILRNLPHAAVAFALTRYAGLNKSITSS